MRMFNAARFSLRGLVADLALAPVVGMAADNSGQLSDAWSETWGDTYEWSAVLQSVDAEAGTAVLQALGFRHKGSCCRPGQQRACSEALQRYRINENGKRLARSGPGAFASLSRLRQNAGKGENRC